jgi:transcriptional regulator with XRE-family HTH domain
LRELGQRTGLSATHLSEIERGRSSPTVSALVRIAHALGRSPAELLAAESRGQFLLTREEERQLVEGSSEGFAVWALTRPRPGGLLEAFLIRAVPGPLQSIRCIEEGTLVCFYSLAGRTRIGMRDRTIVLDSGDSLEAMVVHPIQCASEGNGSEVLAIVARRVPAQSC